MGSSIMSVYSACQFFNELDILELRLEVLDSVVDYHIITESDITNNGKPKPYYIEENKKRFEKFWDKIIYQKLTNLPNDYTNLSPNSAMNGMERMMIERVNAGNWWPHNNPGYGRETWEKESVLLQMGKCKGSDIIILSDVDEIPNPDTVKNITDNFDKKQIYKLKQRMFYYYFNMEKEDNWIGPTILSFGQFMQHSFCEIRVHKPGILVENGGWHFSYAGGYEGALRKLNAINEVGMAESAKPSLQESIDNCLISGYDLFHRPCKFWLTPIDESFPKYLIDNLDKYKDYIKQ